MIFIIDLFGFKILQRDFLFRNCQLLNQISKIEISAVTAVTERIDRRIIFVKEQIFPILRL